MKLTNETNKITKKYFKDWSCNRHSVLKIDGKCGPCPKNCDTCSEYKLCDICLPNYKLNEERDGCEKCDEIEIYDLVTKQCVRRLKDSNALQFGQFVNRVASSSEFLGPDNHGEVMVVQGTLYLKNRSGSQHKMYVGKDDPIYPDDNIQIIVSINSVDQEVYLLTLRTDENIERDFYLTVPVPKLSYLKIKFRLSSYGNVEDYDYLRLKGYSFEKGSYISNYTRHRLGSVSTSLDIQTGPAKKTNSQLIKKILDYSGMGITDFKEVTTRLMHFDSLEKETQDRIKGLKLVLTKAIK